MSILTNAQFFVYISVGALFVYLNLQYIFNIYKYVTPIQNTEKLYLDAESAKDNSKLVHDEVIYILEWTSKNVAPFKFLGSGRDAFVKKKCLFTNCFITDNRTYFPSVNDFEAVLFNGKNVTEMHQEDLPKTRSMKQNYIFGAMESSHNYPICDPVFDGYFNWTWTYKLDSDFRWGYITIYDLDGNVVGPKKGMEWPQVLQPISEELRGKLKGKTKAAAWFVSHCRTKSGRENFVEKVENELKMFNLTVDVFGRCGSNNCKRFDKDCYETLKSDYYFYFSFENSFAEDYVTEKLLVALLNYAVPVVYGGADYTRFLPPGSYLNARELGPAKLAKEMYAIMSNQTRYEDFHRWRNHYKFKETSSFEDLCNLCTMLNDGNRARGVKHQEFRKWWNVNEHTCGPRVKRMGDIYSENLEPDLRLI